MIQNRRHEEVKKIFNSTKIHSPNYNLIKINVEASRSSLSFFLTIFLSFLEIFKREKGKWESF